MKDERTNDQSTVGVLSEFRLLQCGNIPGGTVWTANRTDESAKKMPRACSAMLNDVYTKEIGIRGAVVVAECGNVTYQNVRMK